MRDGTQDEKRRCDRAGLTSPVITHSRLLSSPQTLISNWTRHSQLWHMPEQRMHYLQVSSHSFSKTWRSKCAMSFLLEEKCRVGGGKKQQQGGEEAGGLKTNVDSVNEHIGMCDIYTPCSLSAPIHLRHPHCPSHPSFSDGVCCKCKVSWI